ncbi:MAG TPA: cytochrome c biogenesis protein/redoxin [Candidatus Acidoferrales bacterium]|nr:cytochrome c biogenesis protein/redoxin [Candidatus Acidoferrales bacterium]
MPLVLTFAFVGGLLTILAPCTLPVVPLVLGAAGGGNNRRAIGIVLGFGASFLTLSVLLASVLATAGLSTGQLRTASALALGILGASLALPAFGDRLLSRLAPVGRLGSRIGARPGGMLAGAAVGAAIGIVWAPCVGPIMAAVLAVASTGGPTVRTLAIAIAYVAGAAVPLLAIAVLGRRVVRAAGSPGRRARLQQAFGVLMLTASLVVVAGYDLPLETAVASVLPDSWATEPGLLAAGPAVAPVASTSHGSSVPDANALPASPAPNGPGANALPAPLASNLPATVPLEDLGPAPELQGITAWINSPPLSIASLRGKVVLVHFWTFACINCLHVQPYVKAWYARYAAAGFVVLGVHTPELSFERDIANVRAAVASDGVTFPVAFDPAYATWNAYHNKYWPAFYFIDRTGRIRHTWSGEGGYAASEQVIRELLAEPA